MLRVAPLEAPRHRDDRQRRHRRGQHHVRDQDGEVERSHEALARERHRADLRVVNEVADQEERRHGERRDHELPVQIDTAETHQCVAAEQKDPGHRVQARVDGGKIVDGNHQALSLEADLSSTRIDVWSGCSRTLPWFGTDS
jgi:hypothetical protein